MDIYMPSCVTERASGEPAGRAGSSARGSGVRVGWGGEAQGAGDICVQTADSYGPTAEANTTL